MKDVEWLHLFEKSPKKARAALVSEYGNLIYAIVASRLRNIHDRSEIEDCVSDVFVEIFTSIPKYSQEKGTLKAFVCTIAIRTAINTFKRNMHRYTVTSSIDNDETILPPSDRNTEEDVSKSLFHKRLWEIVDSLGEPDSTIIVYQYVYEFKIHEIADKLSMTPASVQKRSIRARERIKKILEKENYTQEG